MNGRTVMRRALLAGVAMLCALSLLAVDAVVVRAQESQPEVPEVQDDPEVRQAREALDEARVLLERLTAELDAAAAAYEHAQAHHLRLIEEGETAEEQIALARAQVEAAERAFADRVASAYKQPETRLGLVEAVLMAPDPRTALHRAELVAVLTERGAGQLERAGRLETLTADAVRQQQVVTAGTAAAAEERERFAQDLTLAVQDAQRQVEQAESALDTAEEAAVRRAEEHAAAERAAAAAAQAPAAGHLPPVNGKVCPIGAPNGFIDSWGFPRSGGRRHQGVDMFAAYGMPVYAVADGVVRVTTNRLGGLSVHLTDDSRDRYYYAHLSAVAVSTGQRVRAGDVVGANGDSGNARGTPPHLHWQYHPGGGPPVNPYPLAVALCRP